MVQKQDELQKDNDALRADLDNVKKGRIESVGGESDTDKNGGFSHVGEVMGHCIVLRWVKARIRV